MNNQQDITKFELLLKLGENIVVQRFFNVKDYNPQARRSLDLYEYVKNICEEIGDDLKLKTSTYLCENQNYFLNSEVVEEDLNEQKEYFLLELKLNDEVFISRIFPAHYYHPKIRYTVDVRPRLKEYLSDLTSILSSTKLETTYLNYQL
jgi:hypothetical protein